MTVLWQHYLTSVGAETVTELEAPPKGNITRNIIKLETSDIRRICIIASSQSGISVWMLRFWCSTMEFLGVLVVRGPDWEWNDQDGGEGSVGTVVQIGSVTRSEPVVLVQWDCGRKAKYRAGVDGERHLFTSCDGCQRKPIVGFRWHCKEGPNYNLCTQCYMSDCPHNGRTFERIDKNGGKGVEVGKRWGSTKLEARGLFRGAKVIRRQDWKLNDQDSNSNVVGVVEEVFSSNNRDDKDSVRVSWNKGGQTNIYRVDLKCTVPAIGGSYFREHLPPLVLTQKNLQSGFTSGDKVIVELTRKHLEEFSSEHGKWNVDMAIVGNAHLN
ncbi:PREDICTED: E3 ubiquitin-protein ligase MIB2-like isoform X3 [Acropora digitifera]|uniref:E3 ubiquitin-protein ligase MIB2-like isoform X3 n=1 Tax=Acropora digitifera TaxID=70779 RepID=UPI00077AB4BB|nr:PREDICTED: E3 ubiquitin-protein ligase MIB2-like isoform X3 [Acropora digitifera]